MKLGSAIKQIRKKLNVKQFELAKKCNVSQNTMSLIENNVHSPSKKNLNAICKVLKVSEPILHLTSIEKTDVPKENAELFDILFPTIKEMMYKLFIPNTHLKKKK